MQYMNVLQLFIGVLILSIILIALSYIKDGRDLKKLEKEWMDQNKNDKRQ